jgi:hypothetical protein
MLCWISIFGGLLIMMGTTPAQKRCSITSVWKIKFLKTICCGLQIPEFYRNLGFDKRSVMLEWLIETQQSSQHSSKGQKTSGSEYDLGRQPMPSGQRLPRSKRPSPRCS